MGMGLTSNSGLRPEINVTPLIDVLLVLLIIFLLINPAQKKGLPAEVPQDSRATHPPEKSDPTVVLELLYQQNGRSQLKINQSPTEWKDLESRLRDIYKSRAEKIMFVRGEANLDFEDVAEVIDIARSADRGIRIGLITREFRSGD